LSGDWIPVVPPTNVTLWVYSELVKDGVIAASKAQVRSGPGISFKIVGSLEKNQKVMVRETTGEWSGIAPPHGSLLWINRKLVEPASNIKETPSPAVVAPVKTATAPGNVTQSTQKRAVVEPNGPNAAKPQADLPATTQQTRVDNFIADADLIQTMEQGKTVDYEGVVNYASFVLKRPSKYILVVQDQNGRLVDSCYVMGKESQFEALVGRQVRVSGKEYWVQGVRYSVLVPDRIALMSRGAER